MQVVFRVDASVEIGSGHLMRCLTLADALRPMANILFVCRALSPALEQILSIRSYPVVRLPFHQAGHAPDDLPHSHWLGTSQEQDALDTAEVVFAAGGCDWLVIDHYGLDTRFETALRKHVGNILVIDDLADRRHDCDVLVDQNTYADMETRYQGKVPYHCRCLLGTRYCFLRDEFLLEHESRRPRTGPVRSILIYFGGVDSRNYTLEAVGAVLSQAASEIAADRLQVNVVVGSMHPAIDNLQKLCRQYRLGFHVQTREMARLMTKADLAVGAGGISTYERLYLRLPALLTPVADNQREPLRFMTSLGYFQLYENRQDLENLLRKALDNDNVSPPDCVENGIPAIVKTMQQGMTWLQQPSALDIRRTFYWLQDDTLRRDFQLPDQPLREKHFLYWRKLLSNTASRVFAIHHEGRHVGNCGLKNIDLGNGMGELWIYLGDTSIRGKGVATAAVKALQLMARRELHARSLYLHVARQNLPAIRLYRASGFIESQVPLLPPWESRDADIQKMECVL